MPLLVVGRPSIGEGRIPGVIGVGDEDCWDGVLDEEPVFKTPTLRFVNDIGNTSD